MPSGDDPAIQRSSDPARTGCRGCCGAHYIGAPGWLICLDEELEGAEAISEGMYMPLEFGDKGSPTCSVWYCFGNRDNPQTIIVNEVEVIKKTDGNQTVTDVNQTVKNTDPKLLGEISDGKHGEVKVQEFRGHFLVQ